jgi:hypothetical protein
VIIKSAHVHKVASPLWCSSITKATVAITWLLQ